MQEMLHLSYTPLNDRLWEDRLLENYLWDDLNYPGTCYTYMKTRNGTTLPYELNLPFSNFA